VIDQRRERQLPTAPSPSSHGSTAVTFGAIDRRWSIGSSACLRRAHEAIPDAVLGPDDGRRARELELPAQVCDVRSQHLLVLDVRRTPDLLQHGHVGQGPPAVTQQDAQQLELDRREVDGLVPTP
jgi:hypothetical protein